MNGAVASGHPLTSLAAFSVLERGGNAFDAAVAAGFASTVAEPTLTSLGGGGFLLLHESDNGRNSLIDFFVNSPGKGIKNLKAPDMPPVDITFRSTSQRFHIGTGSVAVPGTLKGLLYCYDRYCSMDLKDILTPTLNYLKDGIEVTGPMAYLFKILCPILTYERYGMEIFSLKDGERFHNPLLLEFLSDISPEKWIKRVYDPSDLPLSDKDCLLTLEDLGSYQVTERDPLVISYGGYEILTNPPPSFGGILIDLMFSLYKEHVKAGMKETDRLDLLASVMRSIVSLREEDNKPWNSRFPFNREITDRTLAMIDEIFRGGSAASSRGTTHISILDANGNAVSMTASNGTGSGCFFGDTGIMLNNMMGEDDLHPYGFYSLPPGRRVSSMMSPSIIMSGQQVYSVLGSGGSKRIRTAIPQTVFNLIDRNMNVSDSVEAPRIHFDDEGFLQVEPGLSDEIIDHMSRNFNINQWDHKDMYFGGVHTVMYDHSGHGDTRRGGNYMKVNNAS